MRRLAIRFSRGSLSFLSAWLWPLGRWWCSGIADLDTPDRRRRGYIIVLPGIESRSCIEFQLARGLNDGGIGAAIDVHDWTTGFWPLFLYHLRSEKLHRKAAREIAAKIGSYQTEYPGRPVSLIGYSGGAGVALWTLEALPPERKVAVTILLAAAVSPTFDLAPAASRSECGIRNYYSTLDIAFLGAGLLLLGTIDGRHRIAAGAVGFRVDNNQPQVDLKQFPYHWKMLQCGNFGGHFGYANRLFAAEYLGPELKEAQTAREVAASFPRSSH